MSQTGDNIKVGKLNTDAMFRPAHSPPPNTQQKDELKVGKLRLPQDLCTSGDFSFILK